MDCGVCAIGGYPSGLPTDTWACLRHGYLLGYQHSVTLSFATLSELKHTTRYRRHDTSKIVKHHGRKGLDFVRGEGGGRILFIARCVILSPGVLCYHPVC